jgi:ribonuclease HI
VARKQVLTADEVTGFIASIPRLTAEWRPTERGGTRRRTADEVAAKIVEAFQEAGIVVKGYLEEVEE